jgi:hypothetical protein
MRLSWRPARSILRPGPKWIIMRASMQKANALALMDSHDPNWRAPANGKRAPIRPTSHDVRTGDTDRWTRPFKATPQGQRREDAWSIG